MNRPFPLNDQLSVVSDMKNVHGCSCEAYKENCELCYPSENESTAYAGSVPLAEDTFITEEIMAKCMQYGLLHGQEKLTKFLLKIICVEAREYLLKD